MAKNSSLVMGLLAGGLIMGTLAACDNNTDVPTDDIVTTEPPVTTEKPIEYFKPYQVALDSSVGYEADKDPTKFGKVVDWEIDGEKNPSTIDVVVYDERFEATQNIAFVCSLKLIPGEKPDGHYTDFEFDLGSGKKQYHHFGYTMASGKFKVENAPFQTQAGEIAGCMDKLFDPMIWGDDFGALFAEQDWGLYWGNMASEIEANFEKATDDPADDWDTYDLYNNGYIIGGSNMASAYVGQGPIFYTFGYAVDDKMALIPTENVDNPYERLLGGEMIPPNDGKPKSGVMQVRAAYYWFAKPLLLGVQQ
jgi:hypothetical protein